MNFVKRFYRLFLLTSLSVFIITGCSADSDATQPVVTASAPQVQQTETKNSEAKPVGSTKPIVTPTPSSAPKIKNSNLSKNITNERNTGQSENKIPESNDNSWDGGFKEGWIVIENLYSKQYEISPLWESLLQLYAKEVEEGKLLDKQDMLTQVSMGIQNGYIFAVNVPKEYSETSVSYPLVIFLHGGIAGNLSGSFKRLSNFPRSLSEPYILLAPVKADFDWDPRKIQDVIDEAKNNLRIAHNRIYLTGLSMGGRGTYIVAAELSDTFAAIMPLSSHHEPYSYVGLAPEIESLPIWAFHGDSDLVSSYSMAVDMVDALKAQNTYVRFTTIVDGKHSGWDKIYSTPVNLEWLLAQEKGTPHNYELQVAGGTGSGYYEPGDTVSITPNSEIALNQTITWSYEGDAENFVEEGSKIEFLMPDTDVSISLEIVDSDS